MVQNLTHLREKGETAFGRLYAFMFPDKKRKAVVRFKRCDHATYARRGKAGFLRSLRDVLIFNDKEQSPKFFCIHALPFVEHLSSIY